MIKNLLFAITLTVTINSFAGDTTNIQVHDHTDMTWNGNYDEWEIKTYFLQEMFARGILTYGSHNMNYAHSEADSENILAAYDQVLPLISSAIIENCLGDKLNCDPLRPLFGVRSP